MEECLPPQSSIDSGLPSGACVRKGVSLKRNLLSELDCTVIMSAEWSEVSETSL